MMIRNEKIKFHFCILPHRSRNKSNEMSSKNQTQITMKHKTIREKKGGCRRSEKKIGRELEID